MTSRTRLALVAAVLLVGAVILAVVLGSRSETGGEGGPPEVPTPRFAFRVDWPDDLDEEARAKLRPHLEALASGDATRAGDAMHALRARPLIETLRPRARSVLRVLRSFLDPFLRASPEPLPRTSLGVLAAWVEAVPFENRTSLAATLPLASLETLLGASSDPRTRTDVVTLLGSVPGPRTLVLLLRPVEDPDQEVRLSALRSLARRPDHRAPTLFAKRFESETSRAVQAEILRIWSREPDLRPADLVALLEPLLATEDDEIRVAALDLAGVHGDRSLLDEVAAALDREDRETRLAAIVALGRMPGPEAGRALRAVEDPGAEDRELSERLAWARRECDEPR
jgi:hypothetical protein